MGEGYQTGRDSWVGIRVRRGTDEGTVSRDYNSMFRILTVKMDDGSEAEIVMNNVGPDPVAVHKWEWYCEHYDPAPKWLRF